MHYFTLDTKIFKKNIFINFSKKYQNNQTSPIIKNYIFYEELVKLKS